MRAEQTCPDCGALMIVVGKSAMCDNGHRMIRCNPWDCETVACEGWVRDA